jgi:hypothetical protein
MEAEAPAVEARVVEAEAPTVQAGWWRPRRQHGGWGSGGQGAGGGG